MEHLLAFMYRGETTVHPQVLLPLIDAAKLLGIQGLIDPGNIKQLNEQNGTKEDDSEDKLVIEDDNIEETNVTSGTIISSGKAETVEEMLTQELNESVNNQEKPKPDSSNNVVFPQIPANCAVGAFTAKFYKSPQSSADNEEKSPSPEKPETASVTESMNKVNIISNSVNNSSSIRISNSNSNSISKQ